MNREDYKHKVLEMLNDTAVYKQLDTDDTKLVKAQSDDLILSLKDNKLINIKQTRNLLNYTACTPKFYGVPKIHKKDNPLRPIVSQIKGPTESINKYIHELLLVGEAEIPYLFKDTTAFLQFIEEYKTLDCSNIILVTMDVVSLYTNIPHLECTEFVSNHYEATLQHWYKYETGVLQIHYYITC